MAFYILQLLTCLLSLLHYREVMIKFLNIPVQLLMRRMKTRRAAGCCSVRRIWSPCLRSFRSSSCIHTCWGLVCRVRVCTSAWAIFCFRSMYLSAVPFPSGVYESPIRSSQKMMRVFGFASSLVEALALGLQTYNRARYRQLVKRIGHVIRSAHEMGNVRLCKSWTL